MTVTIFNQWKRLREIGQFTLIAIGYEREAKCFYFMLLGIEVSFDFN